MNHRNSYEHQLCLSQGRKGCLWLKIGVRGTVWYGFILLST